MEGKPSLQSNRHWLVICITIGLIGGAWYRLQSPSQLQMGPSPSKAPSFPGQTQAAARPVALGGHPSVSAGESVKVGGRETAVCGVGTVQVDPNEKAGPFNYVKQLTGAAQSRWQQALLNSDDVHERAAALLEQSSGWDYDPITYRATRTHGAAVARDELVQLAAGLNDLPIYAMAVRACQSYDGEVPGAACDRISLAEWADRDPDNAAPWLEIAVAAHARADRAAEFDAVSHAAHAHTVNFYNDSLLAYSNSGMPPETSALERAAYFDGWIGHVGGDGYAHSFARFTYCTAAAVQ